MGRAKRETRDPAQVTAAEFIAALLPSSPNEPKLGDPCVVVSNPWQPPDSTDKLFSPLAYHEGATYAAELYVNWALCSVIEYTDSNGKQKVGPRATNSAWAGQYFLMLDDIGDAKKSCLTLNDPRVIAATYLMETSAGNFQCGYALGEPLDATQSAQLRAGCIAAKLADTGSLKSPHRWCRTPGSVNVKQGRGNWKSVLREWHPQRVYTLDELCELLGVTLDAEVQAPGSGTVEMPADYDKYQDAHFRWMRELPKGARGSIIGPRRSTGFFPIVCPWHDEHSHGRDGAGYKPGFGDSPPAFSCAHSHGEQYRTAQFIEWVIEQRTGAKAEAPAAEPAAMADDAFWNFGEVLAAPYPDWLVEELFARRQVGAVYGESYAGKSTLAFSITMALAGGADVLGDLEQWEGDVGVVYFALEGNLRTRTEPYERKKLLTHRPRIRFERSLKITLDSERAIACDVLHERVAQAKELDPRLALVVVDTLARASGVDENSADLGLIAEAMRLVAEEYDVCVLIVHHSGKDQSKGLRGHSSFHAALDFAIEVQVEKDLDGKVMRRTFTVTKQREGEGGLTKEFEIEGVELGRHPKRMDKRVSGPLAMVKGGEAKKRRPLAGPKQGSVQRKVYDVLRTLVLKASRHPEAREFDAGWGIPTDVLLTAAVGKLSKDSGHDRRRERAFRALSTLATEHVWYEEVAGVQYVILPGKEAK